MNIKSTVSRRQLLVSLSLLLGCQWTSSNVLAIERAVVNDGGVRSQLPEPYLETIRIIADIVIPETETPSASEAGVHFYVDYFLHNFYTRAQRVNFLDRLENTVNTIQNFLKQSDVDQIDYVEALDNQLGEGNENTLYKELKELIIIAYCTSELGATKALRYDPIPGSYQELKLSESHRGWS